MIPGASVCPAQPYQSRRKRLAGVAVRCASAAALAAAAETSAAAAMAAWSVLMSLRLSKTLLDDCSRRRRRHHRGVHRGTVDIFLRSLREEFPTERDVLLHPEAVLQAVPEFALGSHRAKQDVSASAQLSPGLGILILASTAAAVEVHDRERVMRLLRAGDGGGREERGARLRRAWTLRPRRLTCKSQPSRPKKVAKGDPARTAASAKALAPSCQLWRARRELRDTCAGRDGRARGSAAAASEKGGGLKVFFVRAKPCRARKISGSRIREDCSFPRNPRAGTKGEVARGGARAEGMETYPSRRRGRGRTCSYPRLGNAWICVARNGWGAASVARVTLSGMSPGTGRSVSSQQPSRAAGWTKLEPGVKKARSPRVSHAREHGVEILLRR